MIVSGYTMELYCDEPDTDPRHVDPGASGMDGSRTPGPGYGEFVGQTRAECASAARRAGWFVGRVRCLCPQHARGTQP